MVPTLKIGTISRIVSDICFRSNEYSGAPNTVVLAFTGDDLHRIATAMSVKKQYGFTSIKIDAPEYTLYDESDDIGDRIDDESEPSDWPDEGGDLIVFGDCVVFYSQSKYDSGDQIESNSISFEEIMEGFKETE